MNFEKFMKRTDIDKDPQSVSRFENSITNAAGSSSSEKYLYAKYQKYPGLYDLSNLDFINRSQTRYADLCSNKVNKVIGAFLKKYVRPRSKYAVLLSGPAVKSVVDPYLGSGTNTHTDMVIRKEITLNIVSHSSVLDVLSIDKSNRVHDDMSSAYDPRLFYQIDLDSYSFLIRKKSYTSIPEAVLNPKSALDRIAWLYDGNHNMLLVSGSFILEYYIRMQIYDPDKVDPMYGYPSDFLNLYDRSRIRGFSVIPSFKNIIDRADYASLSNILIEFNSAEQSDKADKKSDRSDRSDRSDKADRSHDVSNTMIIDSQQKYTVIEYLILKMMQISHTVILQAYRNMFMMLVYKYKYLRPPNIFAKVIGFDTRFPSLYMILSNISASYAIKTGDLSFISDHSIVSMYHIDMYLIKLFVQTDDLDMFVEYVTRIKLLKKLSASDSKTGRMIVDWLIMYNPLKIISTLIDTKTLRQADELRIIMLTENFSLLPDSIIGYVRCKAQKDEATKAKADKAKADKISVKPDTFTNHNSSIMSDIESGRILDQDVMFEYEYEYEDEDENGSDDCDNVDLNPPQADADQDADVSVKSSDSAESAESVRFAEPMDCIDNGGDGNNDDAENAENVEDANNESAEEINMADAEDVDADADADADADPNPNPNQKTVIRIKNNKDAESSSTNTTESTQPDAVDPDTMLMILDTLEDVIRNGLTHSFFLIYQLCPNILDDGFCSAKYGMPSNTSIANWIRSDISIDILELMIKFRPSIINTGSLLILLVGAYNGEPIDKLVTKLLTSGADFEDTDADGNTILHIIAQKSDIRLMNTVIRLVPSIINHQNNNMMTPIMMAAIAKDESMVYALEGMGADLSYKDSNCNTVYHYICAAGICPGSIVFNEPNSYGFRPSDYSMYCEAFYYFK